MEECLKPIRGTFPVEASDEYVQLQECCENAREKEKLKPDLDSMVSAYEICGVSFSVKM